MKAIIRVNGRVDVIENFYSRFKKYIKVDLFKEVDSTIKNYLIKYDILDVNKDDGKTAPYLDFSSVINKFDESDDFDVDSNLLNIKIDNRTKYDEVLNIRKNYIKSLLNNKEFLNSYDYRDFVDLLNMYFYSEIGIKNCWKIIINPGFNNLNTQKDYERVSFLERKVNKYIDIANSYKKYNFEFYRNINNNPFIRNGIVKPVDIPVEVLLAIDNIEYEVEYV